jgi:hypothetical protein
MARDNESDTRHPLWEKVLSIVILPALASALTALLTVPAAELPKLPGEVGRFLTAPVPLWSLLFAFPAALGVALSRSGLHRSMIGAYREALRDRDFLRREQTEDLRKRLAQLAKEAEARATEAASKGGDLESVRRELATLESFCVLAQDFVQGVLDNFYPLAYEALMRLRDAGARGIKGGRAAFDAAFRDGQDVRSEPTRGRVAYYSGVFFQLVMDIAFMAEVAAELPIELMQEYRRHPEGPPEDSFDAWFVQAKTAVGERVERRWTAAWAEPREWAGPLLDHWMATAPQGPQEEGDNHGEGTEESS